jgi:hypothetical protein
MGGEKMSCRWWLPALLVAWCLVGVVPVRGADSLKKSDSARWLGDWEQGRREARASGKPIFVVFRCEH